MLAREHNQVQAHIQEVVKANNECHDLPSLGQLASLVVSDELCEGPVVDDVGACNARVDLDVCKQSLLIHYSSCWRTRTLDFCCSSVIIDNSSKLNFILHKHPFFYRSEVEATFSSASAPRTHINFLTSVLIVRIMFPFFFHVFCLKVVAIFILV